MCLEKDLNNSSQLYEVYRKQISIFVKEKVIIIEMDQGFSQILNTVKGLKGEELLLKIIQKWEMYQIFLKFMTGFFSYLVNNSRFNNIQEYEKIKLKRMDVQQVKFNKKKQDKSYIEHNNFQKLKNIGYQYYLKFVHEYLKDNIILAFQQEIEKDRNNYKSDLDMLRKISEILVEINKNESKDANETYLHLGKAILTHAKEYYQTKFLEWSEQCTCEEYIQNIITVQKEENRRFKKCLTKFTDTQKQINQLFNDEMVLKYKQILLSKDHGFTFMLENNKTAVLQQIYFLYKNINDNFKDIRQAFGSWVTKIGTGIFDEKIKAIAEEKPEQQKKKKAATDHDLVERIFNEYRDINHLIVTYFDNDPSFQMSFKSALDSFLNILIDDYGLPEILANYTDYILKKDNLTQEELDGKLTQIIEIFNHLSEKDIFLTLYQQQLAMRLLKSESLAGSKYDDESLMITKIKGCCGQGQETKNYEGMVNDIKYTIDLRKNFNEHMSQKPFKIDLYVKVLQEANWPQYKNVNLILPPYIEVIKDEFKAFYQKQKKNQKLNWMNTLGSFDIKMNVTPEKNFLINITPIQLCILLQFEKTDEWIPISTVLESCGFKEEKLSEFQRDMVQLVNKRIILSTKLKNIEKKDDNTEEEQFKFNTEFSYKTKKLSTVYDGPLQKFQRDVVNENREHAVEATIVRIMKSRKTMQFNELVQEVYSLMRKFQTSLPQIKKRIESLVEREYIERDKTDINIYHYKS